MRIVTPGALALGASLVTITAAQAQPASPPPVAPTPGPTTQEPAVAGSTTSATQDDGSIVVTAQKRPSKLETTPVTVNVVSGSVIAEQGLREVKELRASVPGLTVNESPGGFTGVSLRGIGTTSASQLFEQSVGLFVDGVYNPRARQFRNAIFDVERVEVIKGSQGVLFGKNTSVGAVSIISRRPGNSLSGYVAGTYEAEFNSWSTEGAVDVPMGGNAAVRLSGFYGDQGGYVRNVTLNRDEQREKRWLLRGVFAAKLGPSLDATLKLQYSRSRAIGNEFEFVDTPSPATLRAFGIADGGLDNYVKYESSQPLGEQIDRQKSFDPSLTLNLDLGGGYTLSSITGYANYTMEYGFDSDSTPLPIIYNYFRERFNQFTQEVRLSSPVGRPLEFIVGAFYQNQHVDFDYQLRFLNFVIAPNVQLTGITNQNFKQRETAYAGFGQLTWHLTPLLRLDLGARLSRDDKRGDYVKTIPSLLGSATSALPFVSPLGTTSGKIADTTLDASGTLSYNFTPSSVLYASIGRGTKAGAFNNTGLLPLALPSPFIVPKEVATTYEAGIKGRFLAGRAYASFALFHLDIKDYQDSFYSSLARGFLIRSIGAKSTGAELEGRIQAARWLNIYGNAAYTPTARLANGERTQRAPKFTGTIGARVDTQLSRNWGVGGYVQLVHSSDFYNQPPPAPGNNLSGSYNLVGARIAVTYLPANIELSVTGANLTNDRYKEFSFGSPLGVGTIGGFNRPRTIMFGARARF